MDWQIVHVRVTDAATGKLTPVRIRFTTPEGRYLPPLGRAAKFPDHHVPFADGNVLINGQLYAYIDGSCEIQLPAGPVHVEISKGCEYGPVSQTLDRPAGKLALRLSVERRAEFQRDGWYAGDTHVSLDPHAAWLEGSGEGLHVVNVLGGEHLVDPDFVAWPLHWHLIAFSGQQPALARDDCQVIVNTQNEGGWLGELSLLNCHRLVFPLTLELEGFDQWTMLELCDQCHRKGGLVIWPKFPGRLGERLADLILGAVDAVEWTAHGSYGGGAHDPTDSPINGLPEWYRLLGCGFRVPLVGGSGKNRANVAVGAVRTYARLPAGESFTYRGWIEAIRAGRTFATRGPLLRFTVDGNDPGAILPFDASNSGLSIEADAQSVVPFNRVEVVCNGTPIADATAGSDLTAALSLGHRMDRPGWLAVRCFGSDGLLAHTSPVYIGSARPAELGDGQPLLDYLERLPPEVEEAKEHASRLDRLRDIFARAHAALQQRLTGFDGD